MTIPELPPVPEDVHLIRGDTGQDIACELVYVGVDDDGMYQWNILTDVEFDAERGDQITIGVLPARTGLGFAVRQPKGGSP